MIKDFENMVVVDFDTNREIRFRGRQIGAMGDDGVMHIEIDRRANPNIFWLFVDKKAAPIDFQGQTGND